MRDEVVHKPLTESRAGREVPVAVIGEDDDEGLCFAGEDECVEGIYRAQTNPLVGGVGLSVQEV